jgi:hypothetical protein
MTHRFLKWVGVLATACSAHPAMMDPGNDGGRPDASVPLVLTCASFVPCGGDANGQWVVQAPCYEPPPGCAEATVDVSGVHVDGGFRFDPDAGFSADVGVEGMFSAITPLSCLPAGASCGGDCAVSGSTCRCDLPAAATVPEMGSWSAGGGVLMTSSAAAGMLSADYCVSGDVLVLRSRVGSRAFVLNRVHP